MVTAEHGHAAVPDLVVLKLGGNGQFTRLSGGKGPGFVHCGLESQAFTAKKLYPYQAPTAPAANSINANDASIVGLSPGPPASSNTQQQQRVSQQVQSVSNCNTHDQDVSVNSGRSTPRVSSSGTFASRIPAAPSKASTGSNSSNSTAPDNYPNSGNASSMLCCCTEKATAARQPVRLKVSIPVTAATERHHNGAVAAAAAAGGASATSTPAGSRPPQLVGTPKSPIASAVDRSVKAPACNNGFKPGSPAKPWQHCSNSGSCCLTDINSDTSPSDGVSLSGGDKQIRSDNSSSSRGRSHNILRMLSSPTQPSAAAAAVPASSLHPGLGSHGHCAFPAVAAGCLPVISSSPLQQHKERRRAELYALNTILARSEEMRVEGFLAHQQQPGGLSTQAEYSIAAAAGMSAGMPGAAAACINAATGGSSDLGSMHHGV